MVVLKNQFIDMPKKREYNYNKTDPELVVDSWWCGVYGKQDAVTDRRRAPKRPSAALIFHILIRAKYFHRVKYLSELRRRKG